MVVHQDYLARETALLNRRTVSDPEAEDVVRRRVAALAVRLAPEDPDAGHEVLAALGLLVASR